MCEYLVSGIDGLLIHERYLVRVAVQKWVVTGVTDLTSGLDSNSSLRNVSRTFLLLFP
jgi:hypothetical protein